MHATVLTVETCKRTTGIGADTIISIGRYPIPDTGIGLTLDIFIPHERAITLVF